MIDARHEQELAHVLLIELMAHQFAMPVRWIETQNQLMLNKDVDRVVEFGPSSTLTNMMKRNMGTTGVQDTDDANGRQRTLLSVSRNYDDICFKHTPDPDDHSDSQTTISAAEVPAIAVAPSPPPVATSVPSAPHLADIPVPASDALLALIMFDMKKSIDEVPPSSTIKQLADGRSTIQNEVIGNLIDEFGALPSDAENMGLSDLAVSLQTSTNGKLGKRSKNLISKMLSAKMPPSFGQDAVRSHLDTKWGLQNGRQDAVLLLAITNQPIARLENPAVVKEHFDNIVKSYLQARDIPMPESTAGGVQPGAAPTAFDPELADKLLSNQKVLQGKILSVLADHAGLQVTDPNQTLPDCATSSNAQKKCDEYDAELGDEFLDGIRPMFKPGHVRTYDSYWNWVTVDLIRTLHSPAIMDKKTITRIRHFQERLKTCPDSRSSDILAYYTKQLQSQGSENSAKLAEMLSTPNFQSPFELVHDIPSRNKTIPDREDVVNGKLVFECLQDKPLQSPRTQYIHNRQSPRTPYLQDERRTLPRTEKPDLRSLDRLNRSSRINPILTKQFGEWGTDISLTSTYARASRDASHDPKFFRNKNVLITGAGPNSIGAAILKQLLQLGARVIVTTSRPMSDSSKMYQNLYAQYGGPGSLTVIPCNLGSRQDIESVVRHICDEDKLNLELDFLIPFAAISQTGKGIDNIDSQAELAQRLMLTNVIRLMGAVKKHKQSRNMHTRPVQVLIPLSPNRGTFGKDGLYSESKLALMVLLNKRASEDWADYVSICGVVIGWTKGTGLMAQNDKLATAVSRRGVTVFTQDEMAHHIVTLMLPAFTAAAQSQPIIADMNGGLDELDDLAQIVASIRAASAAESETRELVQKELAADRKLVSGSFFDQPKLDVKVKTTVNMNLHFPRLYDYQQDLVPIHKDLHGMIDLESIVVVVGFAEVGPWGSSRTRWEMEAYAALSDAGCLELAVMMGLLKRTPTSNTLQPTGQSHWLDAETGEPVEESEIKPRYEKRILEGTGLRLVQPKPFDHPDREKKQFLQEVLVQHDLEPFQTSAEAAQDFAREHGSKVEVTTISGSDDCSVKFKKGALLYIPKSHKYEHTVVGQVPNGWDPAAYGIPKTIIDNVDPNTLYALICAAETFISAGITDVYELYQHIHTAELATCVGAGIGGMSSLHKLFRQRHMDKPVQNDILAETFINTTSAWLNMLLLSSSGPNRTPVAACATALESLNQGYDLITSGTAKVCLVGGFDDLTNDISHEFANMKATNNTTEDMRDFGRSASETSRPTASSRRGFVESEGCGMQLLTSAKTALDLGLPIYSVIAGVYSASDKIGRSVPAPGKGIMSIVREEPSSFKSPLLNLAYRRRALEMKLRCLEGEQEMQLEHLSSLATSPSSPSLLASAADIAAAHARSVRLARQQYGNAFFASDARISPLRGALAVWNLSADDITFASLHGTSTQLNEKNESEIIHRQLTALGRQRGNPLLAVAQKYLTGHPKGAAAAWMLNGAMQAMDAQLVPGNRNADNIDAALRQWDLLAFPAEPVQVADVKAFMLTSFGFGQKGAQALGVNPRYVLGLLEEGEYAAYVDRREKRERRATREWRDRFWSGKVVDVKDQPPYKDEDMLDWLVDASARLPRGE